MDQTTQTENIDNECETKLKSNTRKPRDPEYFKKYYIEKVKNVKFFCEYCYCDIAKDNYARHNKSKRHLRLIEKSNNTIKSESDEI